MIFRAELFSRGILNSTLNCIIIKLNILIYILLECLLKMLDLKYFLHMSFDRAFTQPDSGNFGILEKSGKIQGITKKF